MKPSGAEEKRIIGGDPTKCGAEGDGAGVGNGGVVTFDRVEEVGRVGVVVRPLILAGRGEICATTVVGVVVENYGGVGGGPGPRELEVVDFTSAILLKTMLQNQ